MVQRIVIFMVLMAVAPFFLLMVYGHFVSQALVRASVADALETTAKGKQSQMLEWFVARKSRVVELGSDKYLADTMGTISTSTSVASLKQRSEIAAAMKTYVDSRKELWPEINSIEIIDLGGTVLASTNVGTTTGTSTVAGEPYFQAIQKVIQENTPMTGAELTDKLYLEDAHVVEENGEKFAAFSATSPIVTNRGTITGIVRVTYGLTDLNAALSGERIKQLGAVSSFAPKETSEGVFVANGSGVVVSDSKADPALGSSRETLEPVKNCRENNEETSGTWINENGMEVVGAASCVQVASGVTWAVVASEQTGSAFGALNRLTLILAGGAGLSLLIALLLGIALRSMIKRNVVTQDTAPAYPGPVA